MKTKMKTGILVGWALALVCAVGAQVVLDTGAQTQAYGIEDVPIDELALTPGLIARARAERGDAPLS